MIKNVRLGQVLVDSGYLTPQQLDEALAVQSTSGGKKLGDILLDLGVVTEDQLIDALQQRLKVPIENLPGTAIPMDVVRLMSEEFARANHMIPVRYSGNSIIIATDDPLNYRAINDFEVRTGKTVEPHLATRQDVMNAIDRYYASSVAQEMVSEANEQFEVETTLAGIDIDEAEMRASSAPVVRLVNQLIEQAYRRRASDLHIEAYEDHVRVRLRIDGELTEIMTVKPVLLAPMITRIKLAANLNIAEKRLPQDGRMTAEVDGARINIRVSTIPTVYGEKAVLRLLSDSKSGILTIAELGMNDYNVERLTDIIQNPNGIILATGPTGSGKTTTLYAVMAVLSQPTINIVSVEDPVEKIIEGINQTQVNPKAGLTFASGLRSLLRQDPDIMMVGEIRDTETAQIAAAAAITGHLVLSSLHTNDASSAYMRFIDMGVEPYVVASSIVGIIAQRLVKKVCPYCKEEYAPGDDERRTLEHFGIEGVEKLARGRGCAKCNYTGFLGRTAIYEIIKTDASIRQLVTEHVKAQEIRSYLATIGFRDMRANAVELMRAGAITIQEMTAKTYSVENTL